MTPLTAGEGLGLLDAALGRDEAVLIPARLDVSTWRARAARGEDIPPLWRGLAGAPARRAAAATTGDAAQTLRQQLAGLPGPEQQQVLTGLVLGHAAAVLGHASPEAIETGQPFLEQGFDSLTMLELRNRVNAGTGLQLPASAVFDHPTPAALGEKLHAELCEVSQPPGTDDADSNDTAPAGDALATNSLGLMYADAVGTGRAAEIMRLFSGLAAFRPAFTTPAELEDIPRPRPISLGRTKPGMICVPSFGGGAEEYERLGEEFRGVRRVWVIPSPGYSAGEPLAASIETLIGTQAESIRKYLNGTPFVLAGYASGGLVARALAAHLEALGTGPAAIVLIDAYPAASEDMPDAASAEDAALTAMAHYSALELGALRETAAPTLLLRPEGSPETGEWALADRLTVIDVPADHRTIMTDHAEETARAINDWLSAQ
jgi:pimeloyl-ACP methyl ester carboxylesterase